MKDLNQKLENIDARIIHGMRRLSMPAARTALFIVFFWFGILKVFGLSPANPLVKALLEHTLPFMSFGTFSVVLGVFEMIIGTSFLFKGLERFAIALLVPHMIMTILPLILLPTVTWQAAFVPTIEGQYIIKNLVIISLALGIAAHLHPLKK